jgi:N utilization substance protein A
MKTDFALAITQLAAEKNLPKEVVLKAVEVALVSAFKKESSFSNQNILVKLASQSGEFEVHVQKVVVEEVRDANSEILLSKARKIREDVQVGDILEVEVTPQNAGRIAAQTVKQVVLQRLREAERDAVFAEYVGREGDIISGVVQRIEPRQIIVSLGRTEAVLPPSEQVRIERYRVGQRIKIYVIEVLRTGKGPQVLVSRTHPGLLRRLFELEVPEIHQGIVEVRAVAREAGYRSKVAVSARQEGIDPVGCCVGLRGIRIQNIVEELNGEKIDVVQWHPDPAVFIASALSPASVLGMELNAKENAASVVVPDRQLSLAIGREGQNARLAAKLTGWRIDIESASMAEEKKAAREAESVSEIVSGEVPAGGEVVGDITPPSEVLIEASTPSEVLDELLELSGEEEVAEEKVEEEKQEVSVTEFVPLPLDRKARGAFAGGQIRFAEDLLVPPRSQSGVKKGKKRGKGATVHSENNVEDGAKRTGKPRKRRDIISEDEPTEI